MRRGLIARSLTRVSQGLKWLLLSLLFSIAAEWIGMTLWWPEEGLAHSRRMLEAEITYLGTDLKRSLIAPDPAAFALAGVSATRRFLYETTQLRDLVSWLRRPATAGESDWSRNTRRFLGPLIDYSLAALQVAQVFVARLAVLTLSMPVFLLFSLVGLVDGLVLRDLRRWGGGRESSFVYHWAKRSALPLWMLAWVLYLAAPVTVHPNLVVIPLATLLAISLAVSARTFKKYL